MKNTIITIFLLIGLQLVTYAQDKGFTKCHFQIRQFKDTEQQLKDFLSTLNTQNNSIYCAIFKPQMCPRCEADINMSYNYLKKVDNNNFFVLWISALDKETGLKYIDLQNFKYDAIIIDTTNFYNNIFDFRSGLLNVSYTIKIDKSHGELITGGDIKDVSLDTYKRIYDTQKPLPKIDKYNEKDKKESQHINIKPLVVKKETKELILPADVLLNEFTEKISFNGRQLICVNELTSTPMYFEQRNNQLIHNKNFTLTVKEEMAFVDTSLVTKERFYEGVKNNMFRVMAGKSVLIDYENIILSYSIPELIRDPYDSTSTSIAYFNQPVFYLWQPKNDFKKNMTFSFFDFDTQLYDLDYFRNHNEFFPRNKTEFLITLKKGFPSYGEIPIDEWKGKEEDYNIFIDSFYNDAALFSVYSLKGNELFKFGKLDDIYKKNKSGYYYSRPIYTSNDKISVYTTGYSGNLNVMKKENEKSNIIDKTIPVFSVSVVDSEKIKPNMEYLKYLGENIYRDYIYDISINHGKINVLAKQRGKTVFYQFSSDGKCLYKGMLEDKNKDIKNLCDYTLISGNSENEIFIIYKLNKNYYIDLLSIDN